MRSTSLKATSTGRRVQGFLDAQAGVVGSVVPVEVRQELDGLVSQLESYAVQQDDADGDASAHVALGQEGRRDVYLRFVRPIARIAKRYLPQAPEINALVMSLADARSADVIAKLVNLADAAESHVAMFVAKGMAPDFVTQLRYAITQLQSNADMRDRHFGRRAAATAGLRMAERELRGLIQQLDALLIPVLRGNPTALADWTSSKHIPKVPVTPLSPATPAPAVVGATPVAVKAAA